jgi:hypothetical protein
MNRDGGLDELGAGGSAATLDSYPRAEPRRNELTRPGSVGAAGKESAPTDDWGSATVSHSGRVGA